MATYQYDKPSKFDYIYDGKSTIIMGYLEQDPAEVHIPPEIEGAVTGGISAGAFRGCQNMTWLTMPETITVIENSAFRGCASLKSVVLPRYLESIGPYAFAECTELKKITMPNTVTRIDIHSFDGCSQLSEVVIIDRDTGARKEFIIGGRQDLPRYFFIGACMRASDKNEAYMDKYDAVFLEGLDEEDMLSVAAFRLRKPYGLTERMKGIYENAIASNVLSLVRADNLDLLALAGQLGCIDVSQIDTYIDIASRNRGHCTAFLLDYKNKHGKRRVRNLTL